MSYEITIYIDNGGVAGHMYVGLTANGVENQYGFEPVGNDYWPTYAGQGIVHNNETTTRNAEKTDKISIELTQQQYTSAKAKAQQIQNNPGEYNGLEGDGNNCVSFANTVARAAGINEGVGNLFADDQLDISYASWYADGIYGDDSLGTSAFLYKIAIILGVTITGVTGLGGAIGASIVAGSITAAVILATTKTPIALDLSGNSRIDLLSATTASNKVFFDIDNDGFREKTSWITGGDGWLETGINKKPNNDNFAFDIMKKFG